VICLANVVFVCIGMLAASGQFVSLEIGNSLIFTLDKSGGNDVLLINGPISKFGDSCYQNWTSSAAASFCSTGLLQCLRTHSIYVPMRLICGVTYNALYEIRVCFAFFVDLLQNARVIEITSKWIRAFQRHQN